MFIGSGHSIGSCSTMSAWQPLPFSMTCDPTRQRSPSGSSTGSSSGCSSGNTCCSSPTPSVDSLDSLLGQSRRVGKPRRVNSARYKTEFCRSFQESGACKYGEKCQFAHGLHELRGVPRHPKYKSELCRTYHSIGFCPYGPRCHFIHSETPELLAVMRRQAAGRVPMLLDPAMAVMLQDLLERQAEVRTCERPVGVSVDRSSSCLAVTPEHVRDMQEIDSLLAKLSLASENRKRKIVGAVPPNVMSSTIASLSCGASDERQSARLPIFSELSDSV